MAILTDMDILTTINIHINMVTDTDTTMVTMITPMLQMTKIHLKSIAKKTPNYQTRHRQLKKLNKRYIIYFQT